jgi:hypothetical protein
LTGKASASAVEKDTAKFKKQKERIMSKDMNQMRQRLKELLLDK